MRLHVINNLNAIEEEVTLQHSRVRVVPTFLGAHTLPPEYKERREDYVNLIVEADVALVCGAGPFLRCLL